MLFIMGFTLDVMFVSVWITKQKSHALGKKPFDRQFNNISNWREWHRNSYDSLPIRLNANNYDYNR